MIKGGDFGHPPANFRHGAFNIAIRGTHPVADTEWAIEIQHNAGKEVTQDIFPCHAHGDAADAAKGK